MKILNIIFLVIFFSSCSKKTDGILFYNAKIYTMDKENPLIDRFVVVNGKFKSTDQDQIAEMSSNGIDSIDLEGKTVIPGLIDAHGHLMNLGNILMNLNVVGDTSIKQIQSKLQVFSENHTELNWIQGRGWDQNLWKEKEFPTSSDLDLIISNRPVVLERVDGHAIWVNTNAMKLAEIGSTTPDPDGGKIIRDNVGNPTGVFVDNATNLITKYIPVPSENENLEALKLAIKECNKFGLTGVHDAGVSFEILKLMKKHLNDDWFNLRIYGMIDGDSTAWKVYKRNGPEIGLNDYRLTVRSLKLYGDGALGSRGAMLIRPYSDDSTNSGLPVTSFEKLKLLSREAVAAGFQVNIHAIGDRANRDVISIFDSVLPKDGIERRFRIEHVQVIQVSDIPKMADLGIIASMQPTHATSDMPWAEKRVGKERIKGAYAWRTILNKGGKLAFGSDFPVESVNPFLGIYSAVTRQDLSGNPQGGWYPEQTMNIIEAVQGFTTWASYASFTENIVGQIKPGQYADFLVLDRNIFEILPNQLPTTKVEKLYFQGKLIKE